MSSDGPSLDPRSSLPAAIAAASATADLDAALQGILDAGVAGLRPSVAAIFLSNPDRPGLSLAAAHGVSDTGGLVADAQDPANPFASAAAERVATFDRDAPMGDGRASTGAYLPLIAVTGGVEWALGAIGMAWPAPRTLESEEREVLTALAALTSLTVDRARLGSTAAERSEWFERMAHSDPLTGLANERTVGRVLELELARAARQGSEVSLAVFDIDDFKAANAEGGRDAGDDMLRRVAAVLAETVRLVDTVGRIGGDEFVVVAPGAAGGLVARRVLDGIAALPPTGGRSISVSAGVARFPMDGTDADALIRSAMEALTRARSAGAGTVAEAEIASEA